jgi:hypothetical protein
MGVFLRTNGYYLAPTCKGSRTMRCLDSPLNRAHFAPSDAAPGWEAEQT